MLLSLTWLISLSTHAEQYDPSTVQTIAPPNAPISIPDKNIGRNLQEHALLLLDDAQAHLDVLPEKSLKILSDNVNLVVSLEDNEQAQWWIATMLAALRMSDLDLLNFSLEQLSALSHTPAFKEEQSRIINSLGVWFRRSGYLEEARSSYLCNYDTQSNQEDRLKTLINLAIVERNLGHYPQAALLNQKALEGALEIEAQELVAVINNNIGIIAFATQDYPSAQQHFHIAMELNQKIQRRSGHILSGLNLLMTFLAQPNLELFDRLAPRMERLLQRAPHSARSSYLTTLKTLRQYASQQTMPPEVAEDFRNHFAHIGDSGIQNLLRPIITLYDVEVEFPEVSENKVYQGDLLVRYPICDWKKYAKESLSTVLKSELTLSP